MDGGDFFHGKFGLLSPLLHRIQNPGSGLINFYRLYQLGDKFPASHPETKGVGVVGGGVRKLLYCLTWI